MILMSVGDHKTLHFFIIVFQIGNIRDDQVDSQHIVLRERQTAVHHNNTVFVFEGSNVHSDLFQSAQRNDFQFSTVTFFQIAPPSLLTSQYPHRPSSD